jgi:hypothetical protein
MLGAVINLVMIFQVLHPCSNTQGKHHLLFIERTYLLKDLPHNPQPGPELQPSCNLIPKSGLLPLFQYYSTRGILIWGEKSSVLDYCIGENPRSYSNYQKEF